MPHMVLDCPHCGSAKVTFNFLAACAADRDGFAVRELSSRWNMFLQCRHCYKGVVVELFGSRDTPADGPATCSGDPRDFGFDMGEMYPKSQGAAVPEHVNEAVARDFAEAASNLSGGRYTSAGMMFRKVLQRSTTALATDRASMKGKDLKQRVDMLADEGVITEAMREWATIIRFEGNSATHGEEEYGEEEFTEESAVQLHRFTELFLTYAVTLPARVARYKTEDES